MSWWSLKPRACRLSAHGAALIDRTDIGCVHKILLKQIGQDNRSIREQANLQDRLRFLPQQKVDPQLALEKRSCNVAAKSGTSTGRSYLQEVSLNSKAARGPSQHESADHPPAQRLQQSPLRGITPATDVSKYSNSRDPGGQHSSAACTTFASTAAAAPAVRTIINSTCTNFGVTYWSLLVSFVARKLHRRC